MILAAYDELILSGLDGLLNLDDVGQMRHCDRRCAAYPSDGEVTVSEDPTDDAVTDSNGLDGLKSKIHSFPRDESMLKHGSLVGDSELVAPPAEPGEWEHDQLDWIEVFDFGESESCDCLLPGNVCLFDVAHSLFVCWFVS